MCANNNAGPLAGSFENKGFVKNAVFGKIKFFLTKF